MGRIHCSIGSGRGKTTSSLGMGIRAYGQGWTIKHFIFLKGIHQNDLTYYGEINTINKLDKEKWQLFIYGSENIPYSGNIDEKTKEEVNKGFEKLKSFVNTNDNKNKTLIILDEINTCLDLDLISVDELSKLLLINQRFQPNVSIIMTGRMDKVESMEILQKVDFISKIDYIKESHDLFGCQRGIEH